MAPEAPDRPFHRNDLSMPVILPKMTKMTPGRGQNPRESSKNALFKVHFYYSLGDFGRRSDLIPRTLHYLRALSFLPIFALAKWAKSRAPRPWRAQRAFPRTNFEKLTGIAGPLLKITTRARLEAKKLTSKLIKN